MSDRSPTLCDYNDDGDDDVHDDIKKFALCFVGRNGLPPCILMPAVKNNGLFIRREARKQFF